MSDRSETFERVLRLSPGRTALLVVDMQRGFVDPGQAMEVPPARDTVPVIRGLVDAFRAAELPVVFTAFVYSPDVPLLVGELHPEHRPATPGAPRGFGLPSSCCLEGDPSTEIVDALQPRAGEPVIRKRQQVYAEETWPLLDIYEARGLLQKVDGMGEIDEVTERLLVALETPAR